MKFKKLLENIYFNISDDITDKDKTIIAKSVATNTYYKTSNFYFVPGENCYVLIKVLKRPTYIRFYFKTYELPRLFPLKESLNNKTLRLIADYIPEEILYGEKSKRILNYVKDGTINCKIKDFFDSYIDLSNTTTWRGDLEF